MSFLKRKPDFEDEKIRAWVGRPDENLNDFVKKAGKQTLEIHGDKGEKILESRVYKAKEDMPGKGNWWKIISKIDKELKVTALVKFEFASGRMTTAKKEFLSVIVYTEKIKEMEKVFGAFYDVTNVCITHYKEFLAINEDLKEVDNGKAKSDRSSRGTGDIKPRR